MEKFVEATSVCPREEKVQLAILYCNLGIVFTKVNQDSKTAEFLQQLYDQYQKNNKP